MKSTFALALAASLPFAMASPYHMLHAARDAEANEDVVIVTDVNVVAVTTQVTVYWTGEPATSAIPTSTSTAVAVPQKHQGQHNHANAHTWTIQKTTEAAPTTTSVSSTVPPPVAEPTTIITVVSTPESTPEPSPSPEPTTSTSTYEAPAWTAPEAVTSVIAQATQAWPTIEAVPALTSDPADFASAPLIAYGSAPTSGSSCLSGTNMQDVILAGTNAWRAKWNASDLSWDNDLASSAQAWANTCPKSTTKADGTEDDSTLHNRAGQNLAWFSNLDTSFAAGAWGDEAVGYQTSNRQGGSGSGGGEVLHFTQQIWKATTKMGCGMNNCKTAGASMDWWVTVCNYDPVGNFANAAENGYTDQYGRTGSYAMNLNYRPLY